MNNERIKEILLDIAPSEIDFSVIQTGKESKRVNGFYQPDTHEIYLHNLNFKSDNMLIYTAVHEYTHHLCTIEKQENDPSYGKACKVHTQEFWAKFGELLKIAEEKGYYSIGWENNEELKALTLDIKENYLAKNGQLMQEFGKKLARAFDLCKEADILVVAIGKPKMIDDSYVKPGATVIDVGIHRTGEGNKLCGDCDYESVEKVAGKITPVPGGVGPMTIAMLMENTYEAALLHNGR